MKAVLFSLALFVASIPAAARADVTPPEVEACSGKAEGADCTLSGASGRCQNATCSRLDYSNGTPPTTKQYSCVQCAVNEGERTDGGTPVDGGASANGGSGSDNGGGCGAIARPSTPKELGALLFAGSFSLLFALRRRRNRA